MLQGHEVTVADNFFTGRKRNVEHWIGHENFELINHDIVNPLYIEGSFSLPLSLAFLFLSSRSLLCPSLSLSLSAFTSLFFLPRALFLSYFFSLFLSLYQCGP